MANDDPIQGFQMGSNLEGKIRELGSEGVPDGWDFYFFCRPFGLLSDFGHPGTRFKIIISDKHIIQTFSIQFINTPFIMIPEARQKNHLFSSSIRKQQHQQYFQSQRKCQPLSQPVLKTLLLSSPNPYYINLINNYMIINSTKLKENPVKQAPFAEYLCIHLVWVDVEKLLVCGHLLQIIRLLRNWLKMEGLDERLICSHELSGLKIKLEELWKIMKDSMNEQLRSEMEMLKVMMHNTQR